MVKGLFDLTGKVALVTGGNGGIGLGMAKGLAMHGATVVIWGNKPEKNERAVEELRSFGGEVRCESVEVSDEGAVRDAIQRIVDEFGRIDTAVANAGISIGRGSMFDITNEDWARIEGINIHGVFYTLREAARHMLARGETGDRGGSLISISSTSAIHGAARNEHYAATKGAVLTMSRAMAVELGPKGIRVNSILPGWTRSDLTEKLQGWDKFNSNVISRAPVGRWGDGDDFAAIAVYLASDHSSFHTGDSIVIDGGYTIY
ncbi:SDR family oxidoreductase [Novosphingobium sp. KCTC 2891]|uniref:SDR family NAD(P)-dependent oxidoreductase n=1 Tax=Novosphingobium sp. KCTC 2891 TaxID=2989730 RepID=UPI002222A002|nr:SDR family oxidoreductase [Novosphingobium sp. KCTC 2891]MCW1382673.1 SDR family oxidoreductase [Novosphingobium sp. KCTC 2891]